MDLFFVFFSIFFYFIKDFFNKYFFFFYYELKLWISSMLFIAFFLISLKIILINNSIILKDNKNYLTL